MNTLLHVQCLELSSVSILQSLALASPSCSSPVSCKQRFSTLGTVICRLHMILDQARGRFLKESGSIWRHCVLLVLLQYDSLTRNEHLFLFRGNLAYFGIPIYRLTKQILFRPGMQGWYMYLYHSEWENIWYWVFWIHITPAIPIWFKNSKMAENYVVIDYTIFSRIKEVIIIKSHTKNIFGGDLEIYFAEDIEMGYPKDRFTKLIPALSHRKK